MSQASRKAMLENRRRPGRILLEAARTVALLGGLVTAAHAADPFHIPDKQELAMKSVAAFPGAPAVVLQREEIVRDSNFTVEHYERIKVLTEEGKKYANFELGSVNVGFFSSHHNDSLKIKEFSGRTIHGDGTIVPYVEAPFEQTQAKVNGMKIKADAYTLPSVEVGSVLEVRYVTQTGGYYVPDWILQQKIPVLSAHYEWQRKPINVVDGEHRMLSTVSHFEILPPGVTLQADSKQRNYELTVTNVPPRPDTNLLPPAEQYLYRVMFSFTPFKTPDEFWEGEGKRWSKEENKFIGSKDDLDMRVLSVVDAAKIDDEKVRKIYEFVMQMENTEFTREHGEHEDAATGLEPLKHAEGVVERRRGSPGELNEAFVALVRAAGLKAYEMIVPDRSESWFHKEYLSFSQFDDMIAIVSINGHEQYFDPGSRYCPYGKLAWWHTGVEGIRQTDRGTEFATTPLPTAAENTTVRSIDVSVGPKGDVNGKLALTFTGSPALSWRRTALKGDEAGLRTELLETVQDWVPKGFEIKIADVQRITEYEKPLTVTLEVSGKLGVLTGKRLVVPLDVFTSQNEALFPHAKRDQAVYYRYAQTREDDVHLTFADSLQVEVAPAEGKAERNGASYQIAVTSKDHDISAKRVLVNTEMLVPASDYAALQAFEQQVEEKDKEIVVLKSSSGA